MGRVDSGLPGGKIMSIVGKTPVIFVTICPNNNDYVEKGGF